MRLSSKIFLAFLLISSTYDVVAHQEVIDTYFDFLEITYLDQSSELSIQEIIERPESFFFEKRNRKTGFRSANNNFWIKIRLRALADGPNKYLLEVGEPPLKKIDFYSIQDGNVLEHFQSGFSIPFERRKEKYRYHLFPINLRDSSIHTYYIHITTLGNINVPLSFHLEEEYQKKDMLQTLELGVGIGLLLLVSLISGVLFFLFRKRVYLLYSLHLLFVILFIISRSGVGFLYLWTNNPEWNTLLIRVGLYGLITSVSLFTISFLRVSTFSKVLAFLLFSDAILHALFGVAIFLGTDPTDLPRVTLSSFLHTVLLITVGVIAIKKGLHQAGIYTVSIMLYSIIGVLHILAFYEITPVIFGKFFVLRFAWYVEVFFLTIGVAYNFKKVFLEKEQLLEKNKWTESQLKNVEGTIDEAHQEIEKRNRELLHSNLEIARRMEKLAAIKEGVEDVDVRQKLEQLIENQHSEHTKRSDWEDFKSIFEQIHPSFFQRVNQEYPKLTQTDLRYVAYVKMGLNSKEIASALNVQVDSLKNTRYRIRKKIGLDPSIKVNDFFLTF